MIRKLEIENFQGKSGSWDFTRVNTLTGPNESGKTGIGAAIVYGIFGTTLTGSNQTDALVSKGTKGMHVKVETNSLCVERTKTRVGGEIKVNGNPTSQSDLDAMLADAGMTFDLFMSVFWPGWLMAQEERRRRAILMSLLPKIDRVQALNEITGRAGLSEAYNLDLSDLDRCAKAVGARLRTTERLIDQWDGEIAGMLKAGKTVAAPLISREKAKLSYDAARAKANALNELEAEWSSFKSRVDSWEDQCVRREADRKRLLKEIESLGDPSCPTCGQKLPKAGAAMDRVKKRGKELQTQLTALDKSIPEPTPPTQERPSRAAIQAANESVENARRILSDAEAAEHAKTGNDAEIAKIKSRRDAALGERGDLEKIVEALKPSGIGQREIEAGIGAIKEAAPSIEIITSETLKNGTVRECLRVAWNAIEYDCLSTGARKKVDLMLSRAVDKLCGGKVPVYFVDDADLIDCEVELPDDRQVFLCRVTDGDALEVATYSADPGNLSRTRHPLDDMPAPEP